MTTRQEHDFLGEKAVPADALYGIHTARAIENFPLSRRPVRAPLIHAYGAVKAACAQANHDVSPWEEDVFNAIMTACTELQEGRLDSHILVDALQGGAGTSTNLNVNEVITNRTLQILGKPLGDYDTVDPIDDINKHQSTNDTYPTALKVAAIWELRKLETSLVTLMEAFQTKEKEFSDIVKVGRTQLQDAVLTTLGRSMSSYAEAFGRDRWRIYKCEERLRTVNLGGTAIGTGLGAPRQYIFKAVERLKELTGIGLARAENMVEATQNHDAFVEVSGILTACATDLLKTCTDLRLMGSGPDCGFGELLLPAMQAGSSIMPGKINPVIPEAVTQAALKVSANHQSIMAACSMGNLELNAFLPLVADALLESIELLYSACTLLAEKCVQGLQANAANCRRQVDTATATLTALVETIGYSAVEEIAAEVQQTGTSIAEVVVRKKLMTQDEFDQLIAPEAVMQLGSRRKRK